MNFAVTISVIIFAFSMFTSCQSTTTLKKVDATGAALNEEPSVTAITGSIPISVRSLDGQAYSIDGKSVTAQAITIFGESRRPLFIDPFRIAFSNRRANLERWQVFAVEPEKGLERRVSFDAGDAEPVAIWDNRLIIASSSDEQKSGERILKEYRESFRPKTTDAQKKESPALEAPLQHLMLERPADGRSGTEWIRVSNDSAPKWLLSFDREMKVGVGVLGTAAFRVTVSRKSRSRENFIWTKLKLENPIPSKEIVDAQMSPLGDRILWSNGSVLWTTNLKGSDSKRIGDDSIPSAIDLAIDPSGQWIVFSTPTSSRGFNLMAVHMSGRCLKTLTELAGDEIEPSFSPDGQTLLFTHRQNDSSVIAQSKFGSAAAAACPAP